MGELRGGKREGAGRKPREAPRKAITIRVEPVDFDKLKQICESTGKSQSQQITDWIKRFKL